MAVRAPGSHPAPSLFRKARHTIAGRVFEGAGGLDAARSLAGAADRLIADLWRELGVPGAAAVATGGYGRGELSPGSDIDIMILCEKKTAAVSEAAKALFYALWDTGMKVGHGLRTRREAIRLARAELDVETAFIDARLVAGDAAVFDRFRAEALARSRDGKFAARLGEATGARRSRAGDASAELEPHLKDGRGGLRDLASIGWLAKVFGTGAAALAGRDLSGAAETIHRVRNALHLAEDSPGDRLLMHLQPRVAATLGYEGPGAAPEVALMRELYAACRQVAFGLDLALHPATAAASEALDPGGFAGGAWTEEARKAFFELLAAGHSGRPGFLALDASGALVGALPEWRGIWCLPQHNVYHRYAVDIHSFEAVAELVELSRRGDGLISRVAADAMREDAEVLLLATLLHDVGKGADGDHSVAGEQLALSAAQRIGLDESAAREVAWLVGHHLLLSETATRRNTRDERLVAELAEQVGDAGRLRRLLVLSAADAMATGPEAWGPWKAALVEELFGSVHQVLESGELAAAGDLAAERTGWLKAELAGVPPAAAGIDEMPRAWLLAHPPEQLLRHSRAMQQAADEGFVLEVRDEGDGQTWEILFAGRDMPGLMSKVTGVLALHGLDVRSAHTYTRSDGVALEIFLVHPIGTEERRFRRVEEDLKKVLRGRIALEPRLAEKRKSYSHRISRGKREEPRVVVDNAVSDLYTVVEVHAPDRIGLLHSITQCLAELALDIHLAKVATYAEDVVDVFYVMDPDGEKVADAEHVGEVERMILHRLNRGD